MAAALCALHGKSVPLPWGRATAVGGRQATRVLMLRAGQELWCRRRDSNLSRFAGVSEAGAHRRNPERSEGPYKRLLVPKKGLEPPHPCGYMDLNHARLPIPPLRHGWKRVGTQLAVAAGKKTFYR